MQLYDAFVDSNARPQPCKRHLSLRLAASEAEVLEAQQLRYRVFVDEMGARPTGRRPGCDQDIFDPYCDHLIVRDEERERVVGTYRVLRFDRARRIGRFYAEQEFDLVRLAHLMPRMAEAGRACIDAEYRSGGVILLLWSGLARYLERHGCDYLIGCASLSMQDGGVNAAAVYQRLARSAQAPIEYRAFPRFPLPQDDLPRDGAPHIPPLLKAYLRAGGWICGEPAWDPDFNTADLLVLLSLSQLTRRYARHFHAGTAI